jgi:hypothetical protein
MSLDDGRLVGNNDWFEQGQAFDGLRFFYEARGTRIDVLYALVRAQVGPDASQAGALPTGKRHLAGFHFGHELARWFRPNLLTIADFDTANGKRMFTAGAVFDGRVTSIFRYAIEGYYQAGRLDDAHAQSAFRAGIDTRVTLPVTARPYVEVKGSFVSGDDDAKDLLAKTFVRPYGDVHDVHGIVDRFGDVARDTDNRGLRDVGGAVGVQPVHGLELRTAYHLFHAMQPLGDLEHFGHEIDVTGAWRFWRFASVDAGYGVFLPGSLWRSQNGQPTPQHFVYATGNVAF